MAPAAIASRPIKTLPMRPILAFGTDTFTEIDGDAEKVE
jgi:hypothetical protein